MSFFVYANRVPRSEEVESTSPVALWHSFRNCELRGITSILSACLATFIKHLQFYGLSAKCGEEDVFQQEEERRLELRADIRDRRARKVRSRERPRKGDLKPPQRESLPLMAATGHGGLVGLPGHIAAATPKRAQPQDRPTSRPHLRGVLLPKTRRA